MKFAPEKAFMPAEVAQFGATGHGSRQGRDGLGRANAVAPVVAPSR